jgi:Rieske 2Fe-2S family protein
MNISPKIRDFLDQCRPGFTLPQAFYNDRDLFDFDVTEILGRSWLMVGFEAELPAVGSYLAVTIGADPILVVRGRDRLIRAFHNTCRHRGSQICPDGHGQTAKLVCPYHQWTYELDGRLLGASRMPSTFLPGEHRLTPLGIGLMGGCIYVSLTPDVPDFAPFSNEVAPLLLPYRLTEAKLAHQSLLVERANWKLVMENARECYHCAMSHPELKRTFPVDIKPGFDFGDDEHNRRFAEKMRGLGLRSEPVEGGWWHAGRYPLNPGIETISLDGNAVVNRRMVATDAPEIGGLRWATEPNSFCHAFADYCFMFTVIPVGPQETHVISKWLVHRDATEGIDYHLDRLIEAWTKTNLQDRALAENNQRGVNGRGYAPGPYSENAEDFVIRFTNWYRQTARLAVTHGATPSATHGTAHSATHSATYGATHGSTPSATPSATDIPAEHPPSR